jgi:hypothetical protein
LFSKLLQCRPFPDLHFPHRMAVALLRKPGCQEKRTWIFAHELSDGIGTYAVD